MSDANTVLLVIGVGLVLLYLVYPKTKVPKQ